MKTSFKRSVEFSRAFVQYKKQVTIETKLKYAGEKILKRLVKVEEDYREQKEDIEIDLANVDGNGSLLYKMIDLKDGGQKKEYDYTPKNQKLLTTKLKALFYDDIFEIEPYISTEVHEGFDETLRPFFEGFIL